jgi:site-specific DNA-methyltransferase (adenine-specific)
MEIKHLTAMESKNIQLLHGDCLEKMKDIPDGSVDMVLCDLPYGTTACKWDSIIPFEPLWEQYNRVIKEMGRLCCFGKLATHYS